MRERKQRTAKKTTKQQCVCPAGHEGGRQADDILHGPRDPSVRITADLGNMGHLKIALSLSLCGCAERRLMLFLTLAKTLKKKKKISRSEKASEETGFGYKDRADIWKSSELTARIFMEIKWLIETLGGL